MKMTLFISCIAFMFTSIISCSDNDNTSDNGPLTLHFENIVGTAAVQLNTDNMPYINSMGEAYKLTWLTYYVSNIKLKKSDGTTFQDPMKSDGSAGYCLIDQNDEGSMDVTLQGIPTGEYTEVSFSIGVDASQVDQGAQTGPLDPAKGLFWSWNSGYIFLAVEGVSPASTETNNVFQYHVGGYKEESGSNQVNNIKTVTLSFNGDSAPVRAQHEPEVHLLFDVNKLFDGTGEQVTFSGNASRHSPKACQSLAGNIADAFVVDHIHAN